jgi:transposase
MSRRAAALRYYEVSESVAIKWLERVERRGCREPVGHGGHRASKLMAHRGCLEAARIEKTDITLSALCDRLLCERGVKADTSMMSRFFRRLGVTFKKIKKDACRARAGPPRHNTKGHSGCPTCAHSRIPMDVIVSGSAVSFRRALQAASMMAS